ncbi:type II secretion system protein GspL [Microbulbifer guangxiensis]|uniref:type II secretion system protein GspL n=1 Tax=Microbulbifer guangxiensis TaxID=2904249 RepID=UPI001F028915|nr:type II secretion system protein GspL [Microbulbifer guangxiensis]
MIKKSSPAEGRPNTSGQIRLLRIVDAPADSGLALQQWAGEGWRTCALPDAARAAFALAEGADVHADSEHSTPPTLEEGDKVLLLLPGHWVWSGTEDIPRAARRQPQAVGYMVEERLAGDVEDLHFVSQPRQGERCSVYAVDRERMAAVLEAVTVMELPVLAVIPEYQLLDRGGDANLLWVDGERVHLWQGEGHGLSMRRQHLQPVIESLAQGGTEDPQAPDNAPESRGLEVLGPVDDMFAAELRTLFGDNLTLTDGFPESELLSRLRPAQLANLLSGEFKPVEPAAQRHWWALPVKVAAACFVLQLVFFVGAGSYFNWRAAAVEAEAEAMFSRLFPNDTPRADIRRQVEGYLRQSSGTGGGFENMLQHLSRVWAQSRSQGLKLQSLRFDGTRGDMVLQLQAKNLSDLDSVVGQLSAGQIRAELLAANELEDGVSGRIRLR